LGFLAIPESQSDKESSVPPTLTVHVEDRAPGTTIVSLAGELDLSTVPRLEDALLEQIEQRAAVMLDLSQLSFIDSSGIGVLMRARQIANGTPISLVIAPGSQVERIFEVAGVAQALSVFSDRTSAMAALDSDDSARVKAAD
jgi:anti-anti-sigma factor